MDAYAWNSHKYYTWMANLSSADVVPKVKKRNNLYRIPIIQ